MHTNTELTTSSCGTTSNYRKDPLVFHREVKGGAWMRTSVCAKRVSQWRSEPRMEISRTRRPERFVSAAVNQVAT